MSFGIASFLGEELKEDKEEDDLNIEKFSFDTGLGTEFESAAKPQEKTVQFDDLGDIKAPEIVTIEAPKIKERANDQAESKPEESRSDTDQSGGLNIDFPNLDLEEIELESISTPEISIDPKVKFPNLTVDTGVDLSGISTPDLTQFLGDASNGLSLDVTSKESQSIVRKGSGDLFGEMKLGDTGLVVDTTGDINNFFKEATKGTQLENADVAKVYNAITNPQDAMVDMGKDFAESYLGEGGGEIVELASNPGEYIKNKGIDEASKAVSNMTGLDSDIVNNLLQGDTQEVVDSVVKKGGTEATKLVVEQVGNAIIPGMGSAIKLIADIFNYSCYLGTAAYAGGYIDKKDYLIFSKYRLRVQSKEPLSKKLWLGYLVSFKNIYKLQLKSRILNSILTHLITKPWLKHMKYKLGLGPFSFIGKFISGMIKAISLCSYYLFYGSAKRLEVKVFSLDILMFYKKVIKIVEREKLWKCNQY